MMPRERKASGGPSAPAQVPTAIPQPQPSPGRNGVDHSAPRVLVWEEWFQNAGTPQKNEMLALAARQGFLYANQVPPAAANGVTNKIPLAQDPAQPRTLANLLAGITDDLTPVALQPLTIIDQPLDAPQREAVARALFTPDVFLLRGLPGTGRSRVIAEILNQTAQRGERALFLANHPEALDSVLIRLVSNQVAFPLRFLDPSENTAALQPAVLSLTLPNRQRVFKEQALQNAMQARADAETQLDQRQCEETCWTSIKELTDHITRVRQKLLENAERMSKISEEVQREAADTSHPGQLANAMAQRERGHLETLKTVQSAIAQQQQKVTAIASDIALLEPEIQILRPMAEAKQRGRWWSPAWWRATFRRQLLTRFGELTGRQQTLQSELQELERGQTENEEKCRRIQNTIAADRDRLINDEKERRRQESLEQDKEHQTKLAEWSAAWNKQVDLLAVPAHRPLAETQEALASAVAAWENQRRLDLENYQFACRWSDFLSETGNRLETRVSEWANVLAGTTSALSHDAAFAEAAAKPFDLLVLEEADLLTDTDISRLAKYASRLVLVAETDETVEAPLAVPTNGLRSEGRRSLVQRLGCFQKLWQALHCDSRRLHDSWSRENGRLCFTFRPIAAQDSTHLEVEHVADFPEIELRILVIPKAPPLLAQVVFPETMPIHEAKSFIYRELEEVAIQGLGRGAWIHEEADKFIFQLNPFLLGETVPLELENGLREWVSPSTANTCRLEFTKAGGWTKPRLDQWLQRHLEVRDLGRTIALQVPHRMMPGLACPIKEILFDKPYLFPSEPMDEGRLEFICVPPLRKDQKVEEKRKTTPYVNGCAGLPREGAGLEQDLANMRLADRIPTALRKDLPRGGFANYLEAQAIVRKLEELLLQDAAAEGPIAVIALYEGQAALLRTMVTQSDVLRAHSASIEIGMPNAFQGRERNTVLVSLTRSHGHRAVPYGDRKTDLATALTRARNRLILFGDVGALVKRSHWQGPLDHLDAAAANLEARRISALVRWLSGSFQNLP